MHHKSEDGRVSVRGKPAVQTAESAHDELQTIMQAYSKDNAPYNLPLTCYLSQTCISRFHLCLGWCVVALNMKLGLGEHVQRGTFTESLRSIRELESTASQLHDIPSNAPQLLPPLRKRRYKTRFDFPWCPQYVYQRPTLEDETRPVRIVF